MTDADNGQISIPLDDSSAEFSECRSWRYSLTRRWADGPLMVWVMCNPSTGDADKLDATLRRVTHFTNANGYGGFVVVNLFAFVSTDPGGLADEDDPVGPLNNKTIDEWCSSSDDITVAWGSVGGKHTKRVKSVLKRLAGKNLLCLGQTPKGHPCHPLRLKKTTRLEPYVPPKPKPKKPRGKKKPPVVAKVMSFKAPS